ncbi:FISUMP domain-containing protein [Bacteroidota bacterium]
MNYLKHIGIFTLFLMICFLCFCEKDIKETNKPVAIAKIIPSHGNTLDEFVFDASESIYEGNEDDLFYKWDFEGNGTWDTPFTKNKKTSHRYNTEGDYKPILIVSNHLSLCDTFHLKLNVKAGFSPPNAEFNFSPDHGNYMVNFVFDASETYDVEDSIESLKFRWDWENDGKWDTDYLSNPIINHSYLNNTYQFPYDSVLIIKLEAIDSSGLKSTTNKRLNIDRFNTNLNINFTISPDSGTIKSNFTFTAIDCYDPEDANNEFLYRWSLKTDFGSTKIATDFMNKPIIKFDEYLEYDEYLGYYDENLGYIKIGNYIMALEVKDKYGLINSLSKSFIVYYINKPPEANFKIIPAGGNINTNFYFRSVYHSTDPDEYPINLKVRWDFDNDGNWDTDFSRENNKIFHKYNSPGTYRVRVEVMDAGGLTDISEHIVMVSNGTNETSYVEHKNPRQLRSEWNYYGTVKIGEQWWTSQNISSEKIGENTYGEYIYSTFYANSLEYFYTYGGLYSIQELEELDKEDQYNYPICPSGWHISTQSDWDELISFIGDSIAAKELKPGGSTDFYALYGGEQSNSKFIGRGKYACFFIPFIEDELPSGNTRYYHILENNDLVKYYRFTKEIRASLRCVQDKL